jgi:hypothetical protein
MQTEGNLQYLLTQGFSANILHRFWSRVTKTDTCWIFTGSNMPTKGYGRIGRGPMNGGYEMAHRLSWMIHFGPIPEGQHVLHNCPGGDNPKCIRPDHLFLGTNFDNVQDMVKKGRHSFGIHSKIDWKEVHEIHALAKAGVMHKDIALRFNLSRTHVGFILSGKRWKLDRVTGPRQNPGPDVI